jgi:hypothetical protein
MQVRQVTRTDLRDAFRNTRDVIHFERWIGLPFEDDLQRAILGHPELIRFLNHYYLWFHFPVAVALFVWLYWRHNEHYLYTRRLMAVVTFVALALHVAFPLAPPRMMPGFTDTMFRYGPSIYNRNTLEGAANQIAAMPSLHFGWAVIVAMTVIRVYPSRWRYVAIVHPVLMGTAIVATANHWWVDGAVAGLIIFLCWAIAKVVSRWRRTREERQWAEMMPAKPFHERPAPALDNAGSTPAPARPVPTPVALHRSAPEPAGAGDRYR